MAEEKEMKKAKAPAKAKKAVPAKAKAKAKAPAKKTAKLDDTGSAMAMARTLRTSPRKLGLLAESIRGLKADQALAELSFSKRRIAGAVKKVLQSAIANAENNHSLDVDRLYVAEAYVGKSMVMKRFHARARGRSSGIRKFFSNVTIIVREQEEAE